MIDGRFYLAIECDNCGEDIFYGVCGTTLVHNGLPVVPITMAEQVQFDCDCGARIDTGELDYVLNTSDCSDEDKDAEDDEANLPA
jgi:hypothetical protein